MVLLNLLLEYFCLCRTSSSRFQWKLCFVNSIPNQDIPNLLSAALVQLRKDTNLLPLFSLLSGNPGQFHFHSFAWVVLLSLWLTFFRFSPILYVQASTQNRVHTERRLSLCRQIKNKLLRKLLLPHPACYVTDAPAQNQKPLPEVL